jgi:hypothetical protein
MLALRRSSRQVVVTYEELDGTDMIGQLLGDGQRLTHQTGHTLSQRVVAPLEVIGFPRQLVVVYPNPADNSTDPKTR